MAVNSSGFNSEINRAMVVPFQPSQGPVEESTGFKLQTAKINFLGPNYINSTVLFDDKRSHSDLEQKGFLAGVDKEVRNYHDFNQLEMDYNLFDHAFQFLKLPTDLQDCACAFQSDLTNQLVGQRFLDCSAEFVLSWAKKNGIVCDIAVAFGGVYRDLDPEKEGVAAKGYHFAHADYHPGALPAFEKNLKVDERLQEHPRAKIVKILNLWTPWNQSKNTLCLLNINSISKDALQSYKDYPQANFWSLSLHDSPGQTWVACDSIGKGQGILFDSCRGVHSAIDLGEVGEGPFRRSFDARFVLMQLNPPQDN